LLINAVDQPSDCNFIVPSIVKRGDLLIAISTSGKSPALAKKLRKELEVQFGGEYETFLTLMGCLREEILSMGLSQGENSRILNEIVDSDILKSLVQGDIVGVDSTLRRILPGDLAITITKCLK
jgi:precorrin-2 dehydrogenase/sirohydrochlorin ferrochelatase